MKPSLYYRIWFIFCTFLLFPFILRSATYYVDNQHPSASNSNPGTLSLPWITIQHALETANPGDTIFVRTGVYAEQLFTTRDGSAASNIILSAYPGEKPILDGAPVSSGRTGVTITHSYFVFKGFDVRNWETGIWMERAGFVEIADCEVRDIAYGIGAADGAHDFTLNRVVIHNFDLYGFDASPSGGADCYNGTFNDCVAHTGRDQNQNVDGFALGHGTQHGFVFNRCGVYNVFDGFDMSARNTTLNQCYAYECWNSGYKLWQDDITLMNCIGYGSASSNVELDYHGSPTKKTLMNCTFFNAQTFTIWIENKNDTLYMHNCILAGGDNIGLAFEQMGTGNYKGDFNLFHNDNQSRGVAVAYTDEFSLTDIANGTWTNYSGQDSHSIVSFSDTSIFVDPAGFDFHLRKTSPAIDKGTSIGAPSIDYDGKKRPYSAGYDIGAFEYQGTTNVDRAESIPGDFQLSGYPNPTQSGAVLTYTLPQRTHVILSIFTLRGEEVVTLVDHERNAGVHSEYWNFTDRSGNRVASGVYVCRITAGNLTQSKNIIFLSKQK